MLRKQSILLIILSLVLVLTALSGGENSNNAEFELGDSIATVNGVTLREELFDKSVERLIHSYQQQVLTLEVENGDMVEERINKSLTK